MDIPKNCLRTIYVFWEFFILFSFVRQLSQKCGSAGLEHYVQMHITEPHCAVLWYKTLSKQNCKANLETFFKEKYGISHLYWKIANLVSYLDFNNFSLKRLEEKNNFYPESLG